MKKKIGIITFHDALNYGAVLQAFALQDFISSIDGCDTEIIDYKPKYRKPFEHQKFSSRNPVKQLIGKLIESSHFIAFKKRDTRFGEFVSKYHRLSTSKFQDFDELNNGSGDYDIIVSGSDQVFNPKRDSNVYYLAFEKFNGKKIAYAPSMGLAKLTEENENIIKPWVRDFEVLSCREEEGASILSKLTETNVPVVCDPVCLLSKEKWHDIAISPSKREYIFVFDLNGGEPLFKLAQKMSKQTGLPIEYATLKGIHPYIKNCNTHHDLGPREWLGYIMDATYVVTDSFHGTMLSLIMGRPVINKIAVASTASRLISLMNRLNISDQLIYDSALFNIDHIKFNPYQSELLKFIEDSKRFLTEAINA